MCVPEILCEISQVQLVAASGLSGIRLLKYDDPPCFVFDGVKMRETRIEAFMQAWGRPAVAGWHRLQW